MIVCCLESIIAMILSEKNNSYDCLLSGKYSSYVPTIFYIRIYIYSFGSYSNCLVP